MTMTIRRVESAGFAAGSSETQDFGIAPGAIDSREAGKWLLKLERGTIAGPPDGPPNSKEPREPAPERRPKCPDGCGSGSSEPERPREPERREPPERDNSNVDK